MGNTIADLKVHAMIHFVETVPAAVVFYLGTRYACCEPFTGTPYYFTGAVLASFTFILGLILTGMSLLVFKTRDPTLHLVNMHRLGTAYGLLVPPSLLWGIAGAVISGSLGICHKNGDKKCYYNDNYEQNRGIAGGLIFMHLVFLVITVRSHERVQQIFKGMGNPNAVQSARTKKLDKIYIEMTGLANNTSTKTKQPNHINGASLQIKPDKTKSSDLNTKIVRRIMSANPLVKKEVKFHTQVDTDIKQDVDNMKILMRQKTKRQHEPKVSGKDNQHDTRLNPSNLPTVRPPSYNNYVHFGTNPHQERPVSGLLPYHVPPLPTDGPLPAHPYNIYGSSSLPDSDFVVVQPGSV